MEYKNTDSGFFESTKGRNGAMNVRTAASDIIQPVDIQAHYQQTIQTHAGAMVAPATESVMASWIDTAGFQEVSLTVTNDATTSQVGYLYWSNDGVGIHGTESVLSGTARYKAGSAPTRARYLKVSVSNGDAAPHTMSAWAYLKA